MAKGSGWLWVLGGVVVLYSVGAARQAQASAAAGGTPATGGGLLQNLFGGILGTTQPAAGAASYVPSGGGFYNPSLPNYQPANYSPTPYSSPGGILPANYGSPYA